MTQGRTLRALPLLIAGVAVLVAFLLQPNSDRVWAPLMVPALAAAAWVGGWRLGLITLAFGLGLRLAFIDAPLWSSPEWTGGWLLVHAGLIAGVHAAARARDDREHARRIQREQAIRAQRAVEARRAAFLAHASTVLASSPDYETTLAAVANLAVPQIADLCIVDILQEDGSIHALAVAHADPSKIQLVRELRRMYPIDPSATYGPPRVLRTGRSVVHEEIAEESPGGLIVHAADARVATALGIRSTMAVPLLIGGRRLGVISFATTESGRRFVASDLRFAEDLARRAAIAVDAARP